MTEQLEKLGLKLYTNLIIWSSRYTPVQSDMNIILFF